MELALSLGDSAKPFSFLDKAAEIPSKDHLGFGMALDGGLHYAKASSDSRVISKDAFQAGDNTSALSDPPQLDLLPLSAVPPTHQPSSHLPIPWLTDALAVAERASSDRFTRGSDVINRASATRTDEALDDGAALSSPSSAVLSSLQIGFCIGSSGGNIERGKRGLEGDAERAGSRTWSDEDENGSTRKKLRLSKEQSAYLEESFKEHTTLNPKQKLALAKQLNLRPRQVEVWFQNRRARTKLKQTEVDCEYLKRCCETLTEENRRLQKELQELRALKTSQPFYKQLPATTLTMCPSCERVATHSSASVTATGIPASQTQPPKMTTMSSTLNQKE